MTAGAIEAHPFTVTATDGYQLAATRFVGAHSHRGTIVVAGATGVDRRFYRRFAEWSAARGYEVITVDYRGIGGSAPDSLRGFSMDYGDWARLDIEAVIAEANEDRPLYLVGHSYGGVAFGLIPSIHRVWGLYTFGSGTGWHGWMPRLEAARVLALWHVVGPLTTRLLGYMPGKIIGLGSDMPLGVYRDWKRWTRFRRFFFDDPLMAEAVSPLREVRIPVTAVNATDDRWAMPRSRDALMSGYTGIDLTSVDVDPSDIGVGTIGHVGYFRPEASALWDEALAWFDRLEESGSRRVA